jgi:hypothetical protein
MQSSLPRHPSVDHLKKQAKMLLAAQRAGQPASCRFFRRLRRFSEATDKDVLSARVSLADAQRALAMQYGYGSWKELAEEARSHPPQAEFSLARVMAHSEQPIPDYAGAGVPLAIVAALNHAGVPVRFMEFAAASGWAFSVGYVYDDISAAFMAVRGQPGSDGPLEVFALLPEQLGLGYELARTDQPAQLWRFVRSKVDSGTPVMSEHMDGGLITAYRMKRGRREIFFEGTVDTGWKTADGLGPYAVYSFVRRREPLPMEEVTRSALARAVQKGRAHEWGGVPQGLAALRAYLADVRDPARTFEETAEWFCWAAFERLMARRCAEIWLGSVGRKLSGEAGRLISVAADHFGAAFRHYDLYLGETQGRNPPRPTLFERARVPERIDRCAPLLEQGIDEEASGLEALEAAVELL